MRFSLNILYGFIWTGYFDGFLFYIWSPVLFYKELKAIFFFSLTHHSDLETLKTWILNFLAIITPVTASSQNVCQIRRLWIQPTKSPLWKYTPKYNFYWAKGSINLSLKRNLFAAATTSALCVSNHLQSFVIALCPEWNRCSLMIECTVGIDQRGDVWGFRCRKILHWCQLG